MADKKAKIPNTTTPIGVAVYPKLNKADTKFQPDGEYSIKLKLEGNDAEKLTQFMDEQHALAVEQARRENPKLKKVKEGALPYKPEVDDDNNETGATIFNFKMKAHVVMRSGDSFDQKPAVFDAKGSPIDMKKVQVWGGSKVRVSFQAVPYYTAALGAGVSLRLQGVKILELVTGTGGKSAGALGFDEEEDGFAYTPDQAETGEDGEAGSEQEDF